MAAINLSTTLKVKPDKLWAAVRDVGAASSLFDVVSKSSMNGYKRACTLADGAELKETVLSIDDENRRAEYATVGNLARSCPRLGDRPRRDAPSGSRALRTHNFRVRPFGF